MSVRHEDPASRAASFLVGATPPRPGSCRSRAKTLQRIADALAVTTDWLLTGKDREA
jgi:hypothetical protein